MDDGIVTSTDKLAKVNSTDVIEDVVDSNLTATIRQERSIPSRNSISSETKSASTSEDEVVDFLILLP